MTSLHFLLGRRGLLPGDANRVPDALDLGDDAPVLVSDLAEVVDLLDQVVQAPHLEQDLELGRFPGLVELDEPLLQAPLCELVLRDQEFEPARLLLVFRLEAGKARAMLGEVGLELGHERREAPDFALERADLRAGRLDLAREHALFLLRTRDLSL